MAHSRGALEQMPFDQFDVSKVGGVPLARCSIRDAVGEVIHSAISGDAYPVRFVNAYSVVTANQDHAYGTLLSASGTNLPDGTPVALLMKADLRRRGTASRTRGPSFMKFVISEGRSAAIRHFLLGGTPETLGRLAQNIEQRWPGTVIAGTYAPPFAKLDADYVNKCVEAVAGSGANIVWVGVGSPKQDYLAAAIADGGHCIAIGVGAAFDFVSGSVREAPSAIQGIGLEWLWRLAAEPRRLWRRYLVGNAQFIWYAATARAR